MGTPAARRRCPCPLLPPLVEEVVGEGPPWLVSDDLWGRVESLLPVRQQRLRKLGRPPLDDRGCLQGIFFVLHTGSSGSGCRRSSASARA
ncbi:transposase [Streptomyces sp. Isolate_219]|uniref:transposase n=1 Tax=Streptomyces sp. Isolate_219 TaxID=2950110 RepID=UPI003966D4D3